MALLGRGNPVQIDRALALPGRPCEPILSAAQNDERTGPLAARVRHNEEMLLKCLAFQSNLNLGFAAALALSNYKALCCFVRAAVAKAGMFHSVHSRVHNDGARVG